MVSVIINTQNYERMLLGGLLLGWVGLTYWRTQALGFFSDDWIFLSDNSIFPTTLSSYLQVNNSARPVYALIAWAINLLVRGSSIWWQVVSSFTVLFSAVSVFHVFKVIYQRLDYAPGTVTFGALAGVGVLVVAPWATAVFVWPTGVLTLWGLIFFCGGYLRIQSAASGMEKLGGMALLLAGCLCYEAYWFAFIPLLVMETDFRFKRSLDVLPIAMLFIIPVVVALVYQRFALPYLLGESWKSISVENLGLIADDLAGLRRIIGESINPASSGLFSSMALTGLVLAWISGSVPLRRVASLTTAVFTGLFISAATYAAVGYGFSSLGVMSRTMAAPSLYAAALFGVLVSGAIEQSNSATRSRKLTTIYMLVLTAVGATMLFGFLVRVKDWVNIQIQSHMVLRSVSSRIERPYLQLQGPEKLAVVVQIEGDPNGEIFGASWELSGGIGTMDPLLVQSGRITFMPAREGVWETMWDGKNVVQRVCTSPKESLVESAPSNRAPLYMRVDPGTGAVLESGRLHKLVSSGCKPAR